MNTSGISKQNVWPCDTVVLKLRTGLNAHQARRLLHCLEPEDNMTWDVAGRTCPPFSSLSVGPRLHGLREAEEASNYLPFWTRPSSPQNDVLKEELEC
eukprot:scaffold110728_cov48-Prasinocladus_malaysianus.AAC.2